VGGNRSSNPVKVGAGWVGVADQVFPFRAWVRNPALRSWPVLLFVVLVSVPPAALVIFFRNPTQSTFDDAAWIFAAYFAVAWLLLLGVIVRPAQVTRQLLSFLVLIALATEAPLALALENALRGNLSNLASSILAVGLPEELAKALPVVVIALLMRRRLSPVDYLFLGAVSGLVFGASEAERYLSSGAGIGSSAVGDLVGVLSYVWRFLTDPITHACWAGLTGYFIGLAVSGQFRPFNVGWIGLAMASVLHGLNDWSGINGRPLWVVVVLVSAILVLGYAKAGVATVAPTAFPPVQPPPPVPGANSGPAWWGTPAGVLASRVRPRSAVSSRAPAKKPWWEE